MIPLGKLVELVAFRTVLGDLPRIPRDYVVEAAKQVLNGEAQIDSFNPEDDKALIPLVDRCYDIARELYKEKLI